MLVPGLVAFAMAGPAFAGVTTRQPGQVGGGPAADVSWQENVAARGVQQVNVAHTAQGVVVADSRLHPAATGGGRGYGMEMFPARTLRAPVTQVSAETDGTVPRGATVAIDFRGRLGPGRWTSWQPAEPGKSAPLGHAVTVVQVRITLWDNAAGASPSVSRLRLTTTRIARPAGTPRSPATLSYQVYATREGLVGGTTANGHVIQDSDHFVALPSGEDLSPDGSDQYSVQVCGPAACETAPVWDIGPWNTDDNYWDPSDQRQEFQDLAQGTPEAQAAYDDGYNGGTDQFGRQVANPAGIDLADGTFYDVGLNDNGYVTVTYLWTNG